jgi:Rrf2 family protein
LEITRRAELAVRALVVLGRAGDRMKAPRLAEALGTTPGFVPQVIGPLVRCGWVRSDPGPAGGYRGAVDLGTISVLEVIEAVDGATDSGRCVVADRACASAAPCVLHVAWTSARAELVGQLGRTTLAEVAPDTSPGAPDGTAPSAPGPPPASAPVPPPAAPSTPPPTRAGEPFEQPEEHLTPWTPT